MAGRRASSRSARLALARPSTLSRKPATPPAGRCASDDERSAWLGKPGASPAEPRPRLARGRPRLARGRLWLARRRPWLARRSPWLARRSPWLARRSPWLARRSALRRQPGAPLAGRSAPAASARRRLRMRSAQQPDRAAIAVSSRRRSDRAAPRRARTGRPCVRLGRPDEQERAARARADAASRSPGAQSAVRSSMFEWGVG